MNTDIAHRLTRARTWLLLDFPFFGELALRLKLVERNSIPTLAVDGRHIFYNAEFVATLSDALTRSALAHEVFHCVFDHIGRRVDRDPRKWNQAGDYVINAQLKTCGLEIGSGWLYNPVYNGMTTDQIYHLLSDSGGDCDDPLDDCMDGDSDTNEVMATDWKIATIQAANSAKQAGKLPDSLARFIEALTTPKVDWRERLRRFVTETSKDDYSWMRPNKHFLGQGFYLPSLYSERMGEIVVAVDTSGSIDQKTLNVFGAEIRAIVQSARPSKTTVIYCDSEINHVDVFSPEDELHFELHGGGGTDFCPPFTYLEKENTVPVCFVYLTDMCGRFPADPGYPVLWCATTDALAPFGETVPIEV
jgi:predicted metal-dependent peptidase